MKSHSRICSLLAIVACAAGIFSATGCASTNAAFEQHSAAVNLVGQGAAFVYLKEAKTPQARSDRAAHIRVVIAAVEGQLTGEQTVTLAELTAFAIAHLPANVSPDDRVLALAFIQTLGQELGNTYGNAGITPQTQVSLRGVLTAIDQIAAIYVTS